VSSFLPVAILHLVAQRSTVFKRGLVTGGVSIVLDIALVDYVGGELRILLVDGCRSTQAVHRSSSRAWTLLRVMVVVVLVLVSAIAIDIGNQLVTAIRLMWIRVIVPTSGMVMFFNTYMARAWKSARGTLVDL
jgi:hypothetical protein